MHDSFTDQALVMITGAVSSTDCMAFADRVLVAPIVYNVTSYLYSVIACGSHRVYI